MPWLPFYATEDDLADLNQVLASERDLALLQPEGGKQWRAVLDYTLRDDGRHVLWHVPSGSLPLMPESGTGDAIGEIADPFAGWTHLRVRDGQPYFGNSTGILRLNLRIHSAKAESSFGMSSIEWIGNYFWALGRVAPEVTKKRWNRLRRQFSKFGPRVPRGWLDRDRRPEVFALPAARTLLQSGAKGDDNPI